MQKQYTLERSKWNIRVGYKSILTKLTIATTLVVGGGTGAWLLINFPTDQIVVLAVFAVVASALQIIKAEGVVSRSSFNLSWVIYAIVYMQFGMSATYGVIVVAYIADWIWNRYPLRVQAFHIATFAIVLFLATLSARTLLTLMGSTSLSQVFSTFMALVVFTATNHILVSRLVFLDRGRANSSSFEEPKALANQAFIMDFGLLCIGASATLLWVVNPYTVVFLFVVVYLLRSVLRIPALEREVYQDSKTGLYNTEYLDQQLQRELLRVRVPERPLCVVMADLDLLREINNNYGHIAGDIVIKKIAQILTALARDQDTVVRFGGEEFTVLMPDTTTGEAYIQAEAMRKAVEAAEFTVSSDFTPIKATMSFGIAECIEPRQRVDDLLHNADLALYEAKSAGRNQCCVYDKRTAYSNPGGTNGVSRFEVHRQMTTYEKPKISEANVGRKRNWQGDPSQRGVPKRKVPVPEEHTSQPSPKIVMHLFMGGVILLALTLGTLLAQPLTWNQVAGLALFVALTALLEWLASDDPSFNIAVPTSTAILIAAVLLFGSVGALATGIAIAFMTRFHKRWELERLLFYASTIILGGVIAAGMLNWIGIAYANLSTFQQVVIAMVSAFIVFVTTTVLEAGYAGMNSSQTWNQIWYERYMRQIVQYIGMGLLAFVLIYIYQLVDVFGVIIMLVPLGLLHYGQREYVKATKQSMEALQQTYSELEEKNAQIEQLNEELLLALASTIDLRDPDVIEHSRQVARYAVMTAEEMGLSEDQISMVRRGGLMHDIGKLAIPEAILFKPDRLTDEEYEIIKDHVTIGADLLDDFATLQSVAYAVRHHHERWDGYGYPDGLAGEDIPVEARLLALADSIEAMASDRPYRNGMNVDDILQEVISNSGTQFDPAVVEAFERVINNYGQDTIVNSAREVVDPDDTDSLLLVEQIESMAA